jgi:hypothetical protein
MTGGFELLAIGGSRGSKYIDGAEQKIVRKSTTIL